MPSLTTYGQTVGRNVPFCTHRSDERPGWSAFRSYRVGAEWRNVETSEATSWSAQHTRHSSADHKRDAVLPAGEMAVQSPGFVVVALDSGSGGNAGADDRLGFLGRRVDQPVGDKGRTVKKHP